MKHLIKTVKTTVLHAGNLHQISITLLLAMLILLFAGPADSRESGTFHYLVAGNISGEDERGNQIKKKNTTLWVSQPGMELNISFFQAENFKNGSGAVCFPGDPNPDGKYTGPFVVSQERDGSAHVDFYFRASGTNGSLDHKYRLELFGTFDDDTNFPPAVGPSGVVMAASAWLMSTEGKGQDRKVTWTGDGDSGFAATVTVTRIK